jgi:hypothetical protein
LPVLPVLPPVEVPPLDTPPLPLYPPQPTRVVEHKRRIIIDIIIFFNFDKKLLFLFFINYLFYF